MRSNTETRDRIIGDWLSNPTFGSALVSPGTAGSIVYLKDLDGVLVLVGTAYDDGSSELRGADLHDALAVLMIEDTANA